MRLAQLESPQNEMKRDGGGGEFGDKKPWLFPLADKKKSIVIKFDSLIDNGVYNVNASFEEILLKKTILYTFLFSLSILFSLAPTVKCDSIT